MSSVILKKGNGMSVVHLKQVKGNKKYKRQHDEECIEKEMDAAMKKSVNFNIVPLQEKKGDPPLFVGVDPGNPKGDASVHVKEKKEGEPK